MLVFSVEIVAKERVMLQETSKCHLYFRSEVKSTSKLLTESSHAPTRTLKV